MTRYVARCSVYMLVSILLIGLATWRYLSANELTGLIYATPGGVPLTLDIDYPVYRRPWPAVILFGPHDGEWKPQLKHDYRCRKLLDALTGHGYAVATVHYRLLGQCHFPAPIEDGKAAVRWLCANAQRYGLNADRIGVVGVSAGVYGACLLGTTGPEDGLEGEKGESPYSSRVQAVVAMGAPVDWTARSWSDLTEQIYLQPFLGAFYTADPERYARASPGTYATPDDPPFLLFHSTDDRVVSVEQARTFAAKLRLAKVPVELDEECGVDHIWTGAKLERALARMLKFFDCYLKPSE